MFVVTSPRAYSFFAWLTFSLGRELFAECFVNLAFVRLQAAFLFDVVADDTGDGAAVGDGDLE